MRKLTFEGFLKQYVAELSGVQTASVHKLAACLNENPRLKEPLFLYALAYDHHLIAVVIVDHQICRKAI